MHRDPVPNDLPAGDLLPDEHVIAQRSGVRLIHADATGLRSLPREGALYLTDRRLIHHNGPPESLDLADITELTVTDNSLLVSLSDGRGVVLEVSSAPELRSEIAVRLRKGQRPSR